jgi:hypothetical protein
LDALASISPSAPTADLAADLAQTTGTNIGKPTITVDPSVSHSGNIQISTPSSGTTSNSNTNPAFPNNGFTIDPNTGQPVMTSLSPDQHPHLRGVKVTGSVNTDMTGSGVLDNLEITLNANNITDSNELTPDGLHWSDDTQVIPNSQSTATGTMSDQNFGVDGPSKPATAHTINPGDGGRITNVGETLSGISLDIIYTVISSDQATWNANNTADPATPQGLAFTGEQYISGADGNSIVALYYGANNLNILYQIVVSGTNIEVPLLISFVATDIDVAQGLNSNLANLMTITPNNTNLKWDGNTVYDSNPAAANLNGASDLPYGGYLGVGFVSHFDYNFYAPAPENPAYPWSNGVRYDLFGSALQAHLITETRIHGTIQYYDNKNNTFHAPDNFIWWPNYPINIPMSHFPGWGS